MAFERHNFKTGDRLYASQLNEIEDGIIENCAKTGDNGVITGYASMEVTGEDVTITDNSAGDMIVTAASITVNNGTANKSWEKKILVTNASTIITLGDQWKWNQNTIPAVTANCLLVLSWCGVKGFAALMSTE